MLIGHGLLEDGQSLGEPERQRLVAFRERLRGLLLAHNNVAHDGEHGSDTHAKALDELVGSVSLRVSFLPDGRPTLEVGSRRRDGRSLNGPLARGDCNG